MKHLTCKLYGINHYFDLDRILHTEAPAQSSTEMQVLCQILHHDQAIAEPRAMEDASLLVRPPRTSCSEMFDKLTFWNSTEKLCMHLAVLAPWVRLR